MGNKLEFNDKIKSIGALQEFYFLCGENTGQIKVNVEVLFKKNKKIAFKCELPIIIAFDTTKTSISIIWEDAGYDREEFRSMGLYGSYSCQYVKMKYLKTKRILEINSSDSNKIIRINYIQHN